MQKLDCFLCLGALLLGAAYPATAKAEELSVDIELTPNTAEAWDVAYRLSVPVEHLVFARGNGDYRADTWTLDDDFILERLGSTDLIRREDRQPFTAFNARLATFSERLPKDYSPFIRFSDGAQAVFTGQFIVGVPDEVDDGRFIDGANNDNTAWADATRVTFDPGYFGRMIIDANVVSEPTALAIGEGEYVYLGNSVVLETPYITAVVDSAAPDWLSELLYESMQATFEYYGKRLGRLPGGKPSLLTTYRALDGMRVSFTGGVIGSQMAIQMGLGAGIDDTPEERAFLARFFAHEAAHLWNNGSVIAADPNEAWMHEGSAEAMAWLALLDLGVYSNHETLALFQTAANDCAGFLEGGPLVQAARRDAFRAYYDCGAVIALATHGSMRKKGGDLFEFWKDLLEAHARQGAYYANDYYRQLDGVSRQLTRRLDKFVTGALPKDSGAVLYILEAGDIAAELEEDGSIAISELP